MFAGTMDVSASLGGDHAQEYIALHGPGQSETLPGVAAQPAQQLDAFGIFNPFGDQVDIEQLRQADDPRDDF